MSKMIEFTYIIKHKVSSEEFTNKDIPENIVIQAYNAYTMQSIYDALIEYVEIDNNSFNIKSRNYKMIKNTEKE